MAKAPDDWKLYTGQRVPHDRIQELPPPPPWRPMRADRKDVQRRALPVPQDESTWPTGNTRARG